MILNIMLVNSCNLTCKFCRFYRNSTREQMEYGRYLRLLDQCEGTIVAGQRIHGVRLDGGREPLLYTRLPDAVLEAKKRGLYTQFATNGVLLTRERAGRLLEAGIDFINFSVTGFTGGVYSYFQGYGLSEAKAAARLEKVRDNIRTLITLKKEMGKPVYLSVSYLLTDESAAEANQAVYFWREMGVHDIFFNTVATLKEPDRFHEYRHFPSGMCIYSLSVAANGDVYPCCQDPGESVVLGNCFERPLKEIVHSKEYYGLADALTRFDGDRLPGACKGCYTISAGRSEQLW